MAGAIIYWFRFVLFYLIGIHVAAVVMALVILLPFAWLLISSVSPPTDLVSSHVH